MASVQGSSPGARAYALAMIELASHDAQAAAFGQEINELAAMMKQDGLVRTFLLDPSLGKQSRWEIIQRTFTGKVSELTLNLLGVLNEKGRAALLPEIAEAYRLMLDERLNRVRVELTVAQQLDPDQMSAVQQRVSSALGKTAMIQQKIDPSIIGGMVLRVEDRIMDASVKAQLDAMRQQLLSARNSK